MPTTHYHSKGDRRALIGFAGVALGIALMPLPLAIYAHTRPAAEATCTTEREYRGAGRWADATTCRIAGIEVSRRLSPLGAAL